MIEPDFGEAQFQQVVNTAFTQFALSHHGVHAHPIIPTLVAECGLGWDTGFYFPWLGFAPISNHEGCNFFIQYKPSKVIESAGGGQWKDWGQKYLRFKIPHTKKVGKTYVDDYHQFDSLRLLAQLNCEVYYATNHVTSRDDLFAEASTGVLLDNVPFLDVREMTTQHHYATFTSNSSYFYLHSDPVKTERLSGLKALGRVLECKRSTLAEGNQQLLSGLEAIGDSDKSVARYLEEFRQLKEVDLPPPREFRELAKFHFLRAAYKEIVGAAVYRI